MKAASMLNQSKVEEHFPLRGCQYLREKFPLPLSDLKLEYLPPSDCHSPGEKVPFLLLLHKTCDNFWGKILLLCVF